MSGGGTLVFGDGWALLRGEVADHAPHLHAAIQMCVAETGALTLQTPDAETLSGRAFLVRPLVEHALTAQGKVTLLYVEPQSPLAFDLFDAADEGDVSAIDPDRMLGLGAGQTLEAWRERLGALASRPSPVDMRLDKALKILASEPGRVSISEAACACGLSDSRLRALARETLGLPLSTWLIWRKLERASRALNDGEMLAEAASASGFADQAHLSRAMRRMFGVTPGAARTVIAQGNR
jgi:AraC-like DNA-binding protein